MSTRRAALGGIVMTPIHNTEDGEFDLDELRAEIERPPDVHFARTSLVALENTHNLCASAAVELSHIAAVSEPRAKRFDFGSSGWCRYRYQSRPLRRRPP
jgi:threonine aldolase